MLAQGLEPRVQYDQGEDADQIVRLRQRRADILPVKAELLAALAGPIAARRVFFVLAKLCFIHVAEPDHIFIATGTVGHAGNAAGPDHRDVDLAVR